MSQKINPTNLRLGKIQIWNIILQNYGKSYFFCLKFLYFYFYILNFFNNFFKSSDLILGNVQINFKQNYLEINIYYSLATISSEKKYFLLIKSHSKILSNWYQNHFVLRFYFKSKLSYSAFLVTAYANQLFKQNISFKKIINIIYLFLFNQLKNKKILYSKFGVTQLILKGFKICLSGRLDNSKTQMSKKLEYSTGVLPLISLDNYIEHSKFTIFSKLGICNFQIWLFFKIK